MLMLNRKFFRNESPIQSDTYSHEKYLECEMQSRNLRGLKIQEIIELLGIDTVWTFAKTVENTKSVFEGLSTLTNPDYIHQIYTALIENKIEPSDAVVYFSLLYQRIGEIEYLKVIDKLRRYDHIRISVPLYAPSWTEALSKKAKDLGLEVHLDYWKNVHIWQRPNKSLLGTVIQNLLDTKREWYVINLIQSDEYIQDITVELKIRILKGAALNLQENRSHRDFYNFNKVLLSIEDQEIQGTELENEVVEMEGLLFHTLNGHLNKGEELHIVRALKWNSNLMIDLLKSYVHINTQNSFIGFEILYNFVNEVDFIICQRKDGSIDFDSVVDYLSALTNCPDIPLRHILIGNLLYAIMVTEGIPSKEFCCVIERLANDDIDKHLYLAIYNSRGVTWRGYFDGGQQERNLANHYAEMAQKVLPHSYRLKRVFDNLEQSYLADAERMDKEALYNKYR